MVAVVLASLLLGSPQADTATFRDGATAVLYARARVRHVAQDTAVHDYHATVRTHWDATVGRSRFARQTPLIAHETIADIVWSRPNDLYMHVLGARTRAPVVRLLRAFGADVESDVDADLRRQLVMDRPWFIPRALGDSIRVMGLPDRAALHPLAEDGTHFYRFAITDSVEVLTPGRRVRAILMRVEPKQFGAALIAGDMWIDEETAEVVRLQVVFLGDYLWDSPEGTTGRDSAEARRESREADRYLSVAADIEYALIDQAHWMPYRQFLSVTAEAPWLVSVAIPVRAVTTFADYRINQGTIVRFALPDSVVADTGRSRERMRIRGPDVSGEGAGSNAEKRAAAQAEYGYIRAGRWREGRWEVDVPPADSLRTYGWEEPLRFSFDPADEQRLRESVEALAALEERLPPEWTGRRRFGLVVDRAADVVRFNRVQGLSVGTTVKLDPGVPFTSILLTGRFGLADRRPTGSVTWRRDGPAGRFEVLAYRRLDETEPWAGGLGIGNSLNALFVGHDDGDYFLATGAALRYTWNYGPLKDVELRLGGERQDSVTADASWALADIWGATDFQSNPPVTEDAFGKVTIRGAHRIGPVDFHEGVEALGNADHFAARTWLGAKAAFSLAGRSGALNVRVGGMSGDSLPQLMYRLGGPHTVRGFPYGVRRGTALWAAQFDIALSRSGLIAPVVFADAGDTFDADPLVGAGVGVSLLHGLVRFNLAHAVHPKGDWRFDLLFRAPR